MSEKCGVCLTVHAPEDGHAQPSWLSIMLFRVIALPFINAMSLFLSAVTLVWGGYLLSEQFMYKVLGVVISLTGAVFIPVSLFYGLAVFTPEVSPLTRTRAGRLGWSVTAHVLACLTVIGGLSAGVSFWAAAFVPAAALVVGPKTLKAVGGAYAVFFCLLYLT